MHRAKSFSKEEFEHVKPKFASGCRQITVGTRGSALARWQAGHVAGLLRQAWPDLRIEIRVLQTRGDQVLDTPLPLIGGKGLFTAELEGALHSGEIDLAVHSLKDLPTEPVDGLCIGAIPARGPAGDVLISRGACCLDALPAGAVIGTSSVRRAAQLLAARPDLRVEPIRGNVDTRLRKIHDPRGIYHAAILAEAGLCRLGLEHESAERLSWDVMLPAPGQGALAVQCRVDEAMLDLLAPIHDKVTAAAVAAERAFLAHLGGGCSLPVAAYGEVVDGQLYVRALVASSDGALVIRVQGGEMTGLPVMAPEALGRRLAEDALARGASELLALERDHVG